jgi:hypothetical protein
MRLSSVCGLHGDVAKQLLYSVRPVCYRHHGDFPCKHHEKVSCIIQLKYTYSIITYAIWWGLQTHLQHETVQISKYDYCPSTPLANQRAACRPTICRQQLELKHIDPFPHNLTIQRRISGESSFFFFTF